MIVLIGCVRIVAIPLPITPYLLIVSWPSYGIYYYYYSISFCMYVSLFFNFFLFVQLSFHDCYILWLFNTSLLFCFFHCILCALFRDTKCLRGYYLPQNINFVSAFYIHLILLLSTQIYKNNFCSGRLIKVGNTRYCCLW